MKIIILMLTLLSYSSFACELTYSPEFIDFSSDENSAGIEVFDAKKKVVAIQAYSLNSLKAQPSSYKKILKLGIIKGYKNINYKSFAELKLQEFPGIFTESINETRDIHFTPKGSDKSIKVGSIPRKAIVSGIYINSSRTFGVVLNGGCSFDVSVLDLRKLSKHKKVSR